MLRPVVAGVDGSPRSLCAARWAAEEAWRRRVPLRLVRIGGSGLLLDLVREEAVRARPGLVVDVQLLAGGGPVADGLLAVARSVDAGLVVLGSGHRAQDFGGLLPGSTALSVAGRCPVPVVLVGVPVRALGEPPPGEVVVGVDSAASDRAVLEFAMRWAAARGACLRVVRARRPRRAEAVVEREARLLHRTVGEVCARYPGTKVVEEVELGSAAEVLAELSGSARLLVLGRRARARFLGPRLGATVRASLSAVRCPVAVIPHA